MCKTVHHTIHRPLDGNYPMHRRIGKTMTEGRNKHDPSTGNREESKRYPKVIKITIRPKTTDKQKILTSARSTRMVQNEDAGHQAIQARLKWGVL